MTDLGRPRQNLNLLPPSGLTVGGKLPLPYDGGAGAVRGWDERPCLPIPTFPHARGKGTCRDRTSPSQSCWEEALWACEELGPLEEARVIEQARGKKAYRAQIDADSRHWDGPSVAPSSGMIADLLSTHINRPRNESQA